MSFKNLTFFKALFIPFRISPIGSILQTINSLVSLAIAPISVLVTAYFIDTALTVVTQGNDAKQIIMPLVTMAVFSIYGYMVSPLFSLVDTNIAIKSRIKLRIPFLEKRVRLEYKHIENPKTADLLDRVWKDPDKQLSGILPRSNKNRRSKLPDYGGFRIICENLRYFSKLCQLCVEP